MLKEVSLSTEGDFYEHQGMPSGFKNVIHIPDDEDIAIVYGPNLSGKSTILSAIENTMGWFNRHLSEGWKSNIGVDAPYTLEFVDEYKLIDNTSEPHKENLAFTYSKKSWKDASLSELLDEIERISSKKSIHESVNPERRSKDLNLKGFYWAHHVLMISSEQIDLRPEVFPHEGRDWIQIRDCGENGECVFIDLRKSIIRVTSTLRSSTEADVGSRFPEGGVNVSLGGVSWPLFWEDGSWGWISPKGNFISKNNKIQSFSIGEKCGVALASHYLAQVPLDVVNHYARNPDIGEFRAILDLFFDNNPFAKTDELKAKLVMRDKKIEERTMPELRAILKALKWFLDDILNDGSGYVPKLSEWVQGGASDKVVVVSDFGPPTESSNSSLPPLEAARRNRSIVDFLKFGSGGNKEDIVERVKRAFRMTLYILSKISGEETVPGHYFESTYYNWRVKSEILLPDMDFEESRELIRGIFGIWDESKVLRDDVRKLRGERISGDEAPEFMRMPNDVEDTEKQEVFMALKELLPVEIEYSNYPMVVGRSGDGEWVRCKSGDGGVEYVQNGFKVIDLFEILFADNSQLVGLGEQKSGPREWPSITQNRRTLVLGVDRVSVGPGTTCIYLGCLHSSMNTSHYCYLHKDEPSREEEDATTGSTTVDNQDSLRPGGGGLEASEGLEAKIKEFHDVLSNVLGDSKELLDSVADLLSDVGREARRWNKDAKWRITTVDDDHYFDDGYGYDDFYAPPEEAIDPVLKLTELFHWADDLPDLGLREEYGGAITKINEIFRLIKSAEADEWPYDSDEAVSGSGLTRIGTEGMVEYTDYRYYLKMERKGYNEGSELHLIKKFSGLINRLGSALLFIREAKKITGIELNISVDGIGSYTRKGSIYDSTSVRKPRLSSGEKHIFAMLVPIATLTLQTWGSFASQLVLIDEPEVSLHVKWQRELYVSLDRVLKEFRGIDGACPIKVILATHSPEFIGSHHGGTNRMGLKERDHVP